MVPIKLKSRLINQPQALALSIFSINNVLNIKKVLCCSVDSDSLRPHGLYSSPGSSVHGDSPGKNTRVGCHSLFQGIFPIQELNLGLLLCRQILYVWASREVPKEGLVLRHSFQFNSSYMDYIPIRWKTCYKLRMNLKINLQPEVLDLEHFQNSCNFSMGYVKKKKKFTTYKCYNNL